VSASSSTGAAVTLSASGLPAGLTLDASTGVISGTPTRSGTSTVTVSARDAAGATGSTSFVWTVRAATVTLGAFPNQRGMVGQRVSLTLTARVDNGLAPSYGARGLPAGLSINRLTGKIAGTPRKAGRFEVTLSATDPTGATARGTISWIVGHALRIRRASLTGAARRAPLVAISLSSPSRTSVIRTISISLPNGLSLVRGRAGIGLHGPAGTRFSASVHRGGLTFTVSRPLSTVSLVVSGPALRESAALAHRIRSGHAGKLPFGVTVKDSKGLPTRLTAAVAPR
jgi:hypothetical protein